MKRSPLSGIKATLWLFSLIILIGLARSIIALVSRIDIVEERRGVLQKEEQRYSALQASLKEATSPAYIEKQAREKLGLVKEGDTVILLSTPAVQKKSGTAEHQSNWEQWWNLFF